MACLNEPSFQSKKATLLRCVNRVTSVDLHYRFELLTTVQIRLWSPVSLLGNLGGLEARSTMI